MQITFEEDLFLLETIRLSGKKWSWISKQMKGRHENAVKNRYISIFRSLKRKKKNNKQIDLNDIDVLIESLKQKKLEGSFPIKKVKLDKDSEYCQTNLLNTLENLSINPIIKAEGTSSTTNILVNEKMENSHNSLIFDNKEIKSLHFIPEINEPKNLIYDISKNYIVPNIYKKKYYHNEDFSDSPNNSQKKYLNLIVRDEIDDMSQRISSISLSDQLLIEASNILSSGLISLSQIFVISGFK